MFLCKVGYLIQYALLSLFIYLVTSCDIFTEGNTYELWTKDVLKILVGLEIFL